MSKPAERPRRPTGPQLVSLEDRRLLSHVSTIPNVAAEIAKTGGTDDSTENHAVVVQAIHISPIQVANSSNSLVMKPHLKVEEALPATINSKSIEKRDADESSDFDLQISGVVRVDTSLLLPARKSGSGSDKVYSSENAGATSSLAAPLTLADQAQRSDRPRALSSAGTAMLPATIAESHQPPSRIDGPFTLKFPLRGQSGSPDLDQSNMVRPSAVPLQAGLITQVLPFCNDKLLLAVENLLGQLEDMILVDPLGVTAAGRCVIVGVAAVATLGAVEIGRRLYKERSDPFKTKVPAMIPGFWTPRLR